MELAKEAHIEADIVCPVPDSGTPAAIGYSQESGIPFALGIIRNAFIGRTFIEPTEPIRNMGVKLKLNINRAVIAGQANRILVDDSVVRGTTIRKIAQHDAGIRCCRSAFPGSQPADPMALLLRRRYTHSESI